jgi:hypothetical protein
MYATWHTHAATATLIIELDKGNINETPGRGKEARSRKDGRLLGDEQSQWRNRLLSAGDEAGFCLLRSRERGGISRGRSKQIY